MRQELITAISTMLQARKLRQSDGHTQPISRGTHPYSDSAVSGAAQYITLDRGVELNPKLTWDGSFKVGLKNMGL